MKKRLLGLLLIVTILLGVLPMPISAAETLKLNAASITIGIGEEYILKANSKSIVKWLSSDKTIAAVDSKGTVTGKKAGNAAIYATVNGEKISCKVNVKKAPDKLTVKDVDVEQGGVSVLTVELPRGTASKKLTYKTSDKKIAMIDNKGNITGVSGGQCKVAVTTFNNITATATVTVAAPGNKPGNIVNGGTIAEYGDWVYYRDGNTGHLFKVRSNGEDRMRIVDDEVLSINVIGNWVYYINESDENQIYRIRTDGKGRKRLNSDKSTYLNAIGDTLYYAVDPETSGGIYSIKSDGSKRKRISKDKAFDLNVIGDRIYYVAETEKEYTFLGNGLDEDRVLKVHNIFKIRTDGTGKTRVNTDNTNTAIVSGDWIYYTVMGVGFLSDDNDHSLYRIRTDGTGKMRVHVYSGSFNIIGEWIYFNNLSFGANPLGLYKMRIDGSQEEFLIEPKDALQKIQVFENWIYYNDRDFVSYEDRYFRIRHDGSEHQRVDEYVSAELDSVEFGAKFEDYVEPDTSIMGNTPGNWATGSEFVENDGWVYFNKDFQTFRVNRKSLKKELFLNGQAANINIADGWMYYVTSLISDEIFKIKLDGTENTILVNDGAWDICVLGDWVYYTSHSYDLSLYRIKTDGSKNTKITGDQVYSLQINGDWIFYSNANDSGSLYRIRVDGTGKTKIADGDLRPFNVDMDWIYYIEVVGTWDSSSVCKIRHDGSDKTVIASGRDANMDGEWIYYSDDNLYKIRADGSEKTKLSNDSNVRNVCVIGDRIYYTYDYYRYYPCTIKKDGTGRKVLTEIRE